MTGFLIYLILGIIVGAITHAVAQYIDRDDPYQDKFVWLVYGIAAALLWPAAVLFGVLALGVRWMSHIVLPFVIAVMKMTETRP